MELLCKLHMRALYLIPGRNRLYETLANGDQFIYWDNLRCNEGIGGVSCQKYWEGTKR